MQTLNAYLFTAGILCIVLGLVHSILGELYIFKNQRKKGKITAWIPKENWTASKIGIIWATWHLASIFGWCIAVILLKIAYLNNHDFEIIVWMIPIMMYGMIAGAFLVIVGTKARHPGWMVLLLITFLLFIGA